MKELLVAIQSAAKNKQRFIISIDGPAASGKSTLASYLEFELDATVFHMDDYFLPQEMKTDERLAIPGGNVYFERLEEEVLSRFEEGFIEFRKYNCITEELEPKTKKVLSKYVVVEGVYSQQKRLKKYYDFNVYTEISKDEQIRRLKKRNPRLLDKFIHEWLPLEEVYFQKEEIKHISDYKISVEK